MLSLFSRLQRLAGQRNPVDAAQAFISPVANQFGALMGSVNQQAFAVSNTLNSVMKRFEEIQETDPDAPVVRAYDHVVEALDGVGIPLLESLSEPSIEEPVADNEEPVADTEEYLSIADLTGVNKNAHEVIDLNQILSGQGNTNLSPMARFASGGASLLENSVLSKTSGIKKIIQPQNFGGPIGSSGGIAPSVVAGLQSFGASVQDSIRDAAESPSGPTLPDISRMQAGQSLKDLYEGRQVAPKYEKGFDGGLLDNADQYFDDFDGERGQRSFVQQHSVGPMTSGQGIGGVLSGILSGGMGSQLGSGVSNILSGGMGSQLGSGVSNMLAGVAGESGKLGGGGRNEVFSGAVNIFKSALSKNANSPKASGVLNVLQTAGQVAAEGLGQLSAGNGPAIKTGEGDPPLPYGEYVVIPTNGKEALATAEDYLRQTKPQTKNSLVPEEPDATNKAEWFSFLESIQLKEKSPEELQAESEAGRERRAEVNRTILGSEHADSVVDLPLYLRDSPGYLVRRLEEEKPCFLVDSNFVGKQSSNIFSRNAMNCQNLCQKNEECFFWTFAPQLALCYMYEVVTGTIQLIMAVSGPKVCPPGTDMTLPDGVGGSFVAMPFQTLLGQGAGDSDGTALSPLQRIVTGVRDTQSSVIGGQRSGESIYQSLGDSFADGFQDGRDGIEFLDHMPDVLGGTLRDNLDRKPDGSPLGVVLDSSGRDVALRSAQMIRGNGPSIFDSASAITRTGGQAFSTFQDPAQRIIGGIAKVVQGDALRNLGLFGGAATGSKFANVPQPGYGIPFVRCLLEEELVAGASSGAVVMQCCVPKTALQNANMRDKITLNSECDPQEMLNMASDVEGQQEGDYFCITVNLESGDTCGTTTIDTEFYTAYQSRMIMPGRMNDALCECVIDKRDETIESGASWVVNMKLKRALDQTRPNNKAARKRASDVFKAVNQVTGEWVKTIGSAASTAGNMLS